MSEEEKQSEINGARRYRDAVRGIGVNKLNNEDRKFLLEVNRDEYEHKTIK